ncbi:uncharacterized protein LOC131162686 [Malania oleifera]|uniref:uncharacterized protein LOC131162686 n=1 Tax=Malania oleifera TaxID=397392 RepID=UPI0025AE61B7|nr:uncharacterized protein LOC131162686 [Malania oleifera]
MANIEFNQGGASGSSGVKQRLADPVVAELQEKIVACDTVDDYRAENTVVDMLSNGLSMEVEDVWNIRGLGHSWSRQKVIIRKYHVAMVAILEPFHNSVAMPRLDSFLGFQYFYCNEDSGGKVWIFLKENYHVDIIHCSDQALSGWVHFNATKILVSFVHAKCSHLEQCFLWEDFQNLCDWESPWLVVGYFNAIRSDTEQIEVVKYGLLEKRFKGRNMSWCNGHIGRSRSWARLDRALVNVTFESLFHSAYMEYLPRKSSDHCPMVVHLSAPRSRRLEKKLVGLIKLKRSGFLKENKTREEIHQGAINYFHNFFTKEQEVVHTDLDPFIQQILTKEENYKLSANPMIEEVRAAVFFILKHSSPGPNGFGSGFYMACWDIIKYDAVEAATNIFRGTELPKFYSSSFIVLIPKVLDLKSFDKFRPISLFSVAYKIFWKILVARLTEVLPKMISQKQGAFIPGHSIFENITLAQEMVHSMHRKNQDGNVMLNIDIAKAYDRVNSRFLLDVLVVFGFGDNFCKIIATNCIESPWFSIMLNGPFKDDFLIFSNGDARSFQNLLKTLEVYEKWLGQYISKEKFVVYFSELLNISMRREIIKTSGFLEGSFPTTYLGIPLVFGQLKARVLEPLVNKIQSKVAGWNLKLLSQGGWLILLKHVLSSMPSQLLVVLGVPHSTLKKVFPGVGENTIWRVRDGWVSFWCYCWLNFRPLCLRVEDISFPLIQVRDCRDDNGWNYERM